MKEFTVLVLVALVSLCFAATDEEYESFREKALIRFINQQRSKRTSRRLIRTTNGWKDHPFYPLYIIDHQKDETTPPIPKCSKYLFGCCWDNMSYALGPNGIGCAICFDVYPYTCKKYLDYCEKPGKYGRFIRYHCFKRCRAC